MLNSGPYATEKTCANYRWSTSLRLLISHYINLYNRLNSGPWGHLTASWWMSGMHIAADV